MNVATFDVYPISTSEQSQIPTLCVGVLLTKERQFIRVERDSAIACERRNRTNSPWEMHSSGPSRLRARRPNARIIVLEYLQLATSYGILLASTISALFGYQ